MAAPITHIYFAEQFLHKRPLDDVGKFFVGTSFPDIRYLEVIQREKSHVEIQDIEQVKSESAFESGRRLHCWIDFVRAKFIQENNVYDYCPESKWITQALKFYEDEVCYLHVSGWSDIIPAFEKVLEEELLFGIQQQDIELWHAALQEYFAAEPSDESRRKVIVSIGMNEGVANEINTLIASLGRNKNVVSIVESCMVDIKKKLK